MVFLGKPYFSGTSLFDRPFPRSLKAWHFSPKPFTLSFRLTEDILLPEECWKKRRNKLPNRVLTMQVSEMNSVIHSKTSTECSRKRMGNSPKMTEETEKLFDIVQVWGSGVRDTERIYKLLRMLKGPNEKFDIVKVRDSGYTR